MNLNGSLEFDDFEMEERRSFSFKPISIFLLVAATLVGSTYAANVRLGNGQAQEFGQGVLSTTTCDDNILVAPKSSYVNGSSGKFLLSEVRITDISNSCQGKALSLNLYSETSSVPLNNYGSIVFTLTDTGTAGLHFELISTHSSIAYIGSSNIDTNTAGLGSNGSVKFKGKSNITFTALISGTGLNYVASDAVKFTLQSVDLSSLMSYPRTDSFSALCTSTTDSSIYDLNALADGSFKKVTALLNVLDAAESFHADYLSMSSNQKSFRASEYQQLSWTGDKFFSYILTTVKSCESRLNNFLLTQTDPEKRDAMNATLQALSDCEDVIAAGRLTFGNIDTSARTYL